MRRAPGVLRRSGRGRRPRRTVTVAHVEQAVLDGPVVAEQAGSRAAGIELVEGHSW